MLLKESYATKLQKTIYILPLSVNKFDDSFKLIFPAKNSLSHLSFKRQ